MFILALTLLLNISADKNIAKYLINNDIDGLIKYYENKAKTNKKYALKLADIYMIYKLEPEKALEKVRSVEKYYRKKYDKILYRKALIYQEKGDFINAAKMYEKLILNYKDKTFFYEDASKAVDICFKKNFQDKVALYKGGHITALEFEEKLRRTPFVRSYDDSLRILKDLLKKDLFYIEALNQGLYKDKKVQENIFFSLRKGIARIWREYEIKKKIKIPDKEIKQFYNQNKERFAIQAKIDIKHLVFDSLDEAKKVFEKIKNNPQIFDSLKPKVKRGLIQSFDKKLFELAFKKKEGEIFLYVSEKPKRIWIVKLIKKYPKTYRKLEQVKGMIERILMRRKEQEKYKEVIEKMKKLFDVKILVKPENIDSFDTLAQIGNGYITKDKLEKVIEEIPPMFRPRFKTPEGKYKLLENLVNEYLAYIDGFEKEYYLKYDVFGNYLDYLRRILNNAYYDKNIKQKVKISEEEIKEFYETKKDSLFKIKESVDFQRIVVNNKDTLKIVLKKLGKVSFLRKMLFFIPIKKEPFDSLVKKYSIAKDKKRFGKYYSIKKGVKLRDVSQKELEIAFKLKEGEVSDPIEVKKDTIIYYSIIKTLKKNPERYAEFDRVKNRIKRILRGKKEGKLLDKTLDELFKKYKVKILLRKEEKTK